LWSSNRQTASNDWLALVKKSVALGGSGPGIPQNAYRPSSRKPTPAANNPARPGAGRALAGRRYFIDRALPGFDHRAGWS